MLSGGCREIKEDNMNRKIEKLRRERGKNCEEISALQGRNKEIDGQITELENTDIIGIVRESGLTPDSLAELLRAMKENAAGVLSHKTIKEESQNEN